MQYPDPPFNALISGMTGCGKTHFVLNLLETEFKNKFEYIIIICPTIPYNKTDDKKFIHSDRDVIPLAIDDRLNEVLGRLIEIYKDCIEQTLIIIDDCANLYDA
jgi:predicted AAA+ superfamily ATPase